MTDTDAARGDFVDALADLFSVAIRDGVTKEQLRADFEGCLSLQMDTNDEAEANAARAAQFRSQPRIPTVVDYARNRFMRVNGPCPCACNHGGFCGGCGHGGCGGR